MLSFHLKLMFVILPNLLRFIGISQLMFSRHYTKMNVFIDLSIIVQFNSISIHLLVHSFIKAKNKVIFMLNFQLFVFASS